MLRRVIAVGDGGGGTSRSSGYLSAAASHELDAEHAFSRFCEALWHGLPRFRFASSRRTWAYVVARHALADVARGPERRRQVVSPSEAPELAQVAAAVRSSTMTFMRTETKSEVARLRESLEPDDRTLLILRVDRNTTWEEIARVLLDEDGEPEDAEIRRRSAALRKRFERIKARLVKLARRHADAD